MNRHVVRVAVGFAVGGLIAALGMFFPAIYLPSNHRTAFDAICRGMIPVTMECIQVGAFLFSGAVGGASLRRGWRPVIGFGLAFGLVGVVCHPLRDWVPVKGGMISFPLWFISIWLAFMLAIASGVAGAIGAAISGLRWRIVLAGTGAFGGAGAIGGALFAILADYSASYVYTGDALVGSYATDGGYSIVLLLIVVLWPFLIIYALGGALFALALEHTSHKRKKLGLCIKCGYELQGLPKHGHQCPECGTPFELSVNDPPAE